jgi:hypothetical protein
MNQKTNELFSPPNPEFAERIKSYLYKFSENSGFEGGKLLFNQLFVCLILLFYELSLLILNFSK